MRKINMSEECVGVVGLDGMYETTNRHLTFTYDLLCSVKNHQLISSIDYEFALFDGEVFEGRVVVGQPFTSDDLDFTDETLLSAVVNDLTEFVCGPNGITIEGVPLDKQEIFKAMLKTALDKIVNKDSSKDGEINKIIRESLFRINNDFPLTYAII